MAHLYKLVHKSLHKKLLGSDDVIFTTQLQWIKEFTRWLILQYL